MPRVHVAVWKTVFLAGFVVYAGIRHVYEKRTRANEKAVQVGEAEIGVLVLVGIGNVVLPMLHLATPWLAFADYAPPAWMPWCGLAVMIAALVLFWRSHADLGLNWSITLVVRKGHELVASGVYRRVRHPMYAAIFLFGTAQGLLLSNWLAGWSAVPTFALLYFVRVPREERMMCERFGDEYRAYMQRTGRLWPRLRMGGLP